MDTPDDATSEPTPTPITEQSQDQIQGVAAPDGSNTTNLAPAIEEPLQPFMANNPEAKLNLASPTLGIIETPWGDESVLLQVPSSDREYIAQLNNVRLPPRLSAILHRREKTLEFIYGFERTDAAIRTRRFAITCEGALFECFYADATDTLRRVSNSFQPKGPAGPTDYRNLASIRNMLRVASRNPESPIGRDYILTSFFIRPIERGEDDLISMLRHVNFYMSYFDKESPRIIFHEDQPRARKGDRAVRYPLGQFPDKINARALDPYLLGLWESSVMSPEPSRRFLYSYQILEYLSFYFMREELYRSVRRVLLAPDAPSRIPEIARQILDVVVEDRTTDEAKLQNLVQQCADPSVLWCEIESKKDVFANDIEFDGGFKLPSLIRAQWGREDFVSAWIPKVPDALRRIRNAIVHSREQRQSRIIAPTANNQHLLRPWSHLIGLVASQVLIHQDV